MRKSRYWIVTISANDNGVVKNITQAICAEDGKFPDNGQIVEVMNRVGGFNIHKNGFSILFMMELSKKDYQSHTLKHSTPKA